jgi:2-polyprenyl-3-methyl-5-hydroxy-6-metoxy-1,4-benzoquinol methylase/polysaccharide pyruvyl transferase WcaK-like protein
LDLDYCPECAHYIQNSGRDKSTLSGGAWDRGKGSNCENELDSAAVEKLDKQAFKRFSEFQKLLTPQDRILEAGSSIGSFVHLLRLFGAKAEGLEPEAAFCEFSKQQYGFEQHNMLLEEFVPELQYDVVFSFHVIDHVIDPHLFVKKIKSLLRPGGTVVLQCPSMELHNFGNMKLTIREPRIHYFNAASMYRLLSAYFTDIRVEYYEAGLSVTAHNFDAKGCNETTFNKYLRQQKRVAGLVDLLPSATENSNFQFGRNLFLQSCFEKGGLADRLNKGLAIGLYKVREYAYLKKEIGTGSRQITHITNFKGWGNNAGDIVLSACVRNTVRQKVKDVRFNIHSLKEEINPALISEINQSKALLIGGGGLFLPDTNPNAVSGWQWAVSKEQLDQIQVPVLLFAIGYNYFPGQNPDELFVRNLNHIIRKSAFVGIRNSGSIASIQNLLDPDLKGKEIRFQPCPTTIIRKQVQGLPVKVQSRNVAVNIAFDRYEKRFGAAIYEKLHQVALALKALEKRSYKIFNVCHLTKDERAEAAFDRVGLKYETVRLQHQLPREIYGFYNQMEVVIGMRGHAQMIPFGLNTKIITLGTHFKMKWFLEDADMLEAYIDMRASGDLKTEILEKFDYVTNASNKVDERIRIAQDRFFAATNENTELIAALLK